MTSRVLPPNTGLRFACCPHCPRFCVGYHLLDCRNLCRLKRWGWQGWNRRGLVADAVDQARERKKAKR